MDFLRFAKSQRYRSRVPLRQLLFTVAVHRALVVEEDETELVAEATVPWDGKVLSPAELLHIYKDLSHFSRQHASAVPGGPPEPRDENGRATVRMDEALASAPAPSAVATPAAASPPLVGTSLPTPAVMLQRLGQLQTAFFTRPTVEDFIDQAEEVAPVVPSQGPGLLAPIILRQHRRDHQPNRRLFLMWATGEFRAGGQPLSSTSSAPTPGEGGVGAGDERGCGVSDGGGIDLDTVTWAGDERVLCTLTSEEDEYVFTAKPNLEVVHTLFVDAACIYTFRITVSKADAAATATGSYRELWSNAETRRGDAVLDPALSPSSIAPLTLLLANVQDLSHYVEQQMESLDTDGEARARRLLRQAAMIAASSSAAPRAAAVTASTLPSAAYVEHGRRRRRGSRTSGDSSFAAASGTAADRSRNGSFSTTILSSPRVLRGTGITTGVGGGGPLHIRPGVLRKMLVVPRGHIQYNVFGTVDRCVGLPAATLFLRCQLVEEGEAAAAAPPWAHGSLASTSSPPPMTRCEFSSQLAHISSFVDDEFVMDVDHVFNLPFQHSWVVSGLPASPLRLVVTAFSEGSAGDGPQAPAAYACVSLPIASPGRHHIKAPMWAPHKTGAEYLHSVLLGGAPGLVDAKQTGPASSHRTGIHVKEGLYADSVGTLHLTTNILHQEGKDGY